MHLKGPVPPVKDAVKPTDCSVENVVLEALNPVKTSSGFENVYVTVNSVSIPRFREAFSSRASPCMIIKFLTRPKWSLVCGSLITIVFWPCTTKLLMSKGPKFTQTFW